MAARRVLLVLSGFIHPPFRGLANVRQALSENGDFEFQEVDSLQAALAQPLDSFAALVLYFHAPADVLSASEVVAFQNFVAAGGGVLALHSATASFKSCPGYFEVLGGRFTGHGAVEPLQVEPTFTPGSPFDGIGAFEITDELYLHELADDIEPHFVVRHGGKPTPYVWTRRYGEGRVCYACPGHRSRSMAHPAVQEIVRSGLRWTTTRS